MSSLRRFSILTYLIILFLSVQSCDILTSTLNLCADKDKISVNIFLVREYISNEDFSVFTPLRSYQLGKNDEYTFDGYYRYSMDKKLTIRANTLLNYGSDLSSFDENFNPITFKDPSGFGSSEFPESIVSIPDPGYKRSLGFKDYSDISEKFMFKSVTPNSTIPELDSDSISSELDIIYQYKKNASEIDTLYKSKYSFIDSTTYKLNYVLYSKYDENGIPLMLISSRKVLLKINRYGVPFKEYEDNETHLVRSYDKTNYDTLYSFIGENPENLNFSSSNAGIFIRNDQSVYQLQNDGSLELLYSGGKSGFVPERASLDGTVVFSDYDGQYYDLKQRRYIDFYSNNNLTKGRIMYAEPSTNDLLAVKLDFGAYGYTQGIYIINTAQMVVSDSIVINDLPPFEVDLYPESTSFNLSNPVFTSDNRLIFMYTANSSHYKCPD